VRCARSRRASLLTEIRRAVASPASVLVCVAVIIGYLRRQALAWTKYITVTSPVVAWRGWKG